jgi:IS30 family transposase
VRGDKFNFDNEALTLTQIAERLSMSVQAIRRHHKAGRFTRQEIMSYEPKAAQRAGGRRGARVMRKVIETTVRDHQDKKARGK